MRLAPTMLLLVLTMATPCLAQSDDFNPYQATLDAMPLAQAEPMIVGSYGPAVTHYSGINKPYDGGPILVMVLGDDPKASFFLFCEDRLAAFSAPVTPKVASAILGPLTHPLTKDTNMTIFPHETGVWFETSDRALSIDYLDVGTQSSWISAGYPADVTRTLNYSKRCDEVATN